MTFVIYYVFFVFAFSFALKALVVISLSIVCHFLYHCNALGSCWACATVFGWVDGYEVGAVGPQLLRELPPQNLSQNRRSRKAPWRWPSPLIGASSCHLVYASLQTNKTPKIIQEFDTYPNFHARSVQNWRPIRPFQLILAKKLSVFQDPFDNRSSSSGEAFLAEELFHEMLEDCSFFTEGSSLFIHLSRRLGKIPPVFWPFWVVNHSGNCLTRRSCQNDSQLGL